jgi:pseudaminic acid biosynthesis-associated methylase
MNARLQFWEGDFGTAYTDRNIGDSALLAKTFSRLLTGLDLNRVLEVGCNRGHNLVGLAGLLPEGSEVVGVEPNQHARGIARQADARITVVEGNAFDLPFEDEHFDLTFTAGVLIHIAPADLPAALREIHRVTRRYVLAIEYFAEKTTAISYRGHDGYLWKRHFLRDYQTHCPSLVLLQSGFVGPEDGFDYCHWWLLEKQQG